LNFILTDRASVKLPLTRAVHLVERPQPPAQGGNYVSKKGKRKIDWKSVDPEREAPWVDGKTRRALINLPPDVTSLTVPPEFLLPGASYEFEILAIEVSGNSTISTGEFDTSE
jgi:hypothetical protein